MTYIDINETDIESVSQATILGVIISFDLSCNAHIYIYDIFAKTRTIVNMIYQLNRVGINQNN